MAECKCGRSPSGNCVGWHNLTEEQYLEKKAAYEEKQSDKWTLFSEATNIDLLWPYALWSTNINISQHLNT